MTCKKRPDIPVAEKGESVVELDTGDLVAVRVVHRRNATTQAPVIEVSARWVNAAGVTQLDAHDAAVTVRHIHHSSHAEVQRHTIRAVLGACLCLVLGEPGETHEVDGHTVPKVPFSAEVCAHQSIRNAIVAAKRTFDIVDAVSLL